MNQTDKKTMWGLFGLLSITILTTLMSPTTYAFDATVNIPEKYSVVKTGERVAYDIQIKYPENRTRVDLRLDYKVADDHNTTIVRSKSLKAIETQASFVDYLVIPETAEEGIHTLAVTISDYNNLERKISTTFMVEDSQSPLEQSSFKMYFMALLGAVCFVGVVTTIDLILRIKKSAKPVI